MQFLAVNRPRPTTTTDQLGPVIPDHLRWVTHEQRTGHIVRAGRWGNGGMCIIEAPDDASAARIINEDPLVAAGLVDVEMAVIVPHPGQPGPGTT